MSTDMEVLGKTSVLAIRAEREEAAGRYAEAKKLYREAAVIVEHHLQFVSFDKEKTSTLFINNAVALWWKSGDIQKCSALAMALLASNPPARVVPRLREFIMLAWQSEQLTHKGVSPPLASATPIWMSLHPFGLPAGYAGIGDVACKLTALENLVWREAEYESVATVGFEPKYKTPVEIRDSVRLITAPMGSGSDSMCLWVQSEPMQVDWFNESQILVPSSSELVYSVTKLLTAAEQHDASAIDSFVSAQGFRNKFMSILMDLAPDGKRLEAVEVSGGTPGVAPIILMPEVRRFAKEQILRTLQTDDIKLFIGSLKGVTAKGDSLGLEVEVDGGTRHNNLYVPRENDMLEQLFDMWEKQVTVMTKRHRQGGGYRFEILSIDEVQPEL